MWAVAFPQVRIQDLDDPENRWQHPDEVRPCKRVAVGIQGLHPQDELDWTFFSPTVTPAMVRESLVRGHEHRTKAAAAMTIAREVYRVEIHPSRRAPITAAAKLAQYIINRWMPDNAGGVILLMGPGLTKQLAQIYLRATMESRDIVLQVDTRNPQVALTEIVR